MPLALPEKKLQACVGLSGSVKMATVGPKPLQVHLQEMNLVLI